MSLLNEPSGTNKIPFYALLTSIFLLICRVGLFFLPLNDSTEARYGEIARKMLETGNWVTPMQDYGVPFWAKPPLSFWLSAFSMKCFGVNEFAARLPSLFFSMGVLWLVFYTAKKMNPSAAAMTAVFILASSLAFFFDAGAVMTDASLLFSCTLTLVAFWEAVVEKKQSWRYWFFVGLGLGLLAKGPLVIVLTGMPIFLWVLFHHEWRALWKNLPWFKGSLLLLLIALPWYLWAEHRTPGFLRYFILGEHFGRFLQSGWQGDKYGYAHSEPLGMIWIMLSMGMLPWTPGVLIWLCKHATKIPSLCRLNRGWMSYWFLCWLTPLLFFTFAKNIIWPYILPSMPAFALLSAAIYHYTVESILLSKRVIIIAASSAFVYTATLSIVWFFEPVFVDVYVTKSQKPVIAFWKDQHPSPNSNLIYWTHQSRPFFSAQFYSAGVAKVSDNPVTLNALLSNHEDNYLITNSAENLAIPNAVLPRMRKINSNQSGDGTFVLYRVMAM